MVKRAATWYTEDALIQASKGATEKERCRKLTKNGVAFEDVGDNETGSRTGWGEAHPVAYLLLGVVTTLL